jgi:hypothetical protein
VIEDAASLSLLPRSVGLADENAGFRFALHRSPAFRGELFSPPGRIVPPENSASRVANQVEVTLMDFDPIVKHSLRGLRGAHEAIFPGDARFLSRRFGDFPCRPAWRGV